MTTGKPVARSDDLVIEELGDEVLIYDHRCNRAHCLTADTVRVWRACDGNTDAEALSKALDLSSDVINETLERLEATELLDRGLGAINVDSNDGAAITRRQLGSKGVKVGGAIVAAPVILSITAPTAMAAVTPPPFICQIFTTQSCGTSDGCASIKGCCCCCQGGGSCKVCSSVNFCNSGQQPCIGGGTGTHCSSVGTVPASTRGCCGVNGAKECGCGWGTGGGCCNQHTGASCSPSSSDPDCVPCCNGKILLTGSQINCCTTNTCITMSPS